MAAGRVNPYAARTAYIRFQASFRPNKNATGIRNRVCDRCSVNQRIEVLQNTISHNYRHIFRHLKMEFALAIPALNE